MILDSGLLFFGHAVVKYRTTTVSELVAQMILRKNISTKTVTWIQVHPKLSSLKLLPDCTEETVTAIRMRCFWRLFGGSAGDFSAISDTWVCTRLQELQPGREEHRLERSLCKWRTDIRDALGKNRFFLKSPSHYYNILLTQIQGWFWVGSIHGSGWVGSVA